MFKSNKEILEMSDSFLLIRNDYFLYKKLYKRIKDHLKKDDFRDKDVMREKIHSIMIEYKLAGCDRSKIISQKELIENILSGNLDDSVREIRAKLKNIMVQRFKAGKTVFNNADDQIVKRILEQKRFCVFKLDKSNDMFKSSILALLYKVMFNNMIDNKISEALDFNSLIRLSILAGGQTIKIPTLKEIEEMVAGVAFYYLMQIEKSTVESARDKIKNELNINISSSKLFQVSKLVTAAWSRELQRDMKSSINTQLDTILNTLKKLLEQLSDAVSNIQDAGEFAKVYNEVNTAFLQMGNMLND